MAQLTEESLLQIIKNDDVKSFNNLMEKAQLGAYRLGRFPVLSLIYLYKSRKILSEYEERFIKITNFTPLREPAEISKAFSAKAGKCLRLYLNEVVSPLEMLLILDKTKRLGRIYPLTKPSAGVKERLKLIYSIKYSLTVKFEGDDIIIDKRPLSYREKKNIATISLCSVLAVAVVVGVPVTVDSLIPKPVEGEVTKLSQIDFSSQEEYTLKNDIVLPENYSVDKVNCTILGEGNKLIFGKGATLGALNGNISDMIIESSGTAVFTSVSEKATVENITVNVNADIVTTEATALIAFTNYGTIDGVTVNVSGSITALAKSEESTAELDFGGIVQNNAVKNGTSTTVYSGVIKNSTVNFSQFELVGDAAANAAFGGIAGINSGSVIDCTVNGEIISDTFDVAGVCAVNSGLISGNLNEADISQTSDSSGWNPISCGIVISNAYVVENCENRGKITSVSTCEETENKLSVSAAGLVYLNNGGIRDCKNVGEVTVKSQTDLDLYAGGITTLTYGEIYKAVNEGSVSVTGSGEAYAGGIAALSRALVSYCYSSGDITISAKQVCAGGIFGFSDILYYYGVIYFGTSDHCISENKINAAVIDDTPSYIGGIVGFIRELGLVGNTSTTYYSGRVINSYFSGEFLSAVDYTGNIVGVCGVNIYEVNSFTAGETEYPILDGNYYLENSLNAVGATLEITDDGNVFNAVENKGASSATEEEMKNSETYKSILSVIENN